MTAAVLPELTGSLAADFALLSDAVTEADAIAMRYFRRSPDVAFKARNDPVSVADIEIDQMLRKRLMAARPGYGWLSEESGEDAERLRFRRVFVVDPIDGTRAFIKGDAAFAISVALIEEGRPVIGIVSAPAEQAVYRAARGVGAWRNDSRLQIGGREELTDCRIIADEQHFRSPKVWSTPWPDMSYIRLPSTALRLAAVSSGAVDAMVSLRPKADWDLAAADLLVHEAGGAVIDAEGRPPLYNRIYPKQPVVIAANRTLLPQIGEHLAPWFNR